MLEKSRPDKKFKRVVLPDPDGPNIAVKFPGENYPVKFFRIGLTFPFPIVASIINLLKATSSLGTFVVI